MSEQASPTTAGDSKKGIKTTIIFVIILAVVAIGICAYAFGYNQSPSSVIIQGELHGEPGDTPVALAFVGTNGVTYNVPLTMSGNDASYSIRVPNHIIYGVRTFWSRSGLVDYGVIVADVQGGWMQSNVISRNFSAPSLID